MAELKDIKEQVEQRLQQQQVNKEFKDVGRVAQTRKAQSAYRLINGSILNQLEEDSVMAYNMVKKDGVWPEIDVKAERDRGVTAGGAFLKVKIREAAPTRPKDEKNKRATYVLFLERLQKDLQECFNVDEIEALAKRYRSLPMNEIIGYFFDPEFLTADQETKTKIENRLKESKNMRMSFIYGGSRLFGQLINEVFGARFENTLLNKSDASHILWREAFSKEPVSAEKAAAEKARFQENKQKFIEANQAHIEEYRTLTVPLLKSYMDTKWTLSPLSKKAYKENIEDFRSWAINYYERRIKLGLSEYDTKIAASVERDNDWSWYENPKTKEASSKPKAEAINTKAPLAYIKRTGGYKIDTNTPEEIVEKFGFSAVNYGVYVNDAWSKEHTKHFLGAMTDMAEFLNIDVKGFNNLGKLAIAFGAKGRPGHMATYFPQTKDINLTRGNGDGSLAHEWGHYFDNVLAELDLKRATNVFYSQRTIKEGELGELFGELMTFIHKGHPDYTPLIPMRFPAKKADMVPTYSRRSATGWESSEVVIKDTIEETIAQYPDLAIVSQEMYTTQKRIFGYIIDSFGLEYYQIPMRLKTSYFYHKSAYALFQYCYTDQKGNIVTAAMTRTKYWTDSVELFARAWETVIYNKIINAGRYSNYLVAGIPMDDIISESYDSPYPSGKELDHIETIIDKIVIAAKKQFGIGGFVAPSELIEDQYVELQSNATGKTEKALVVDEKKESPEVKVTTFIDADKVVDVVVEQTQPVTSVDAGSEAGEWSEAIETLNMLIEGGGTEEQIAEWKDAVDTLKLLSEPTSESSVEKVEEVQRAVSPEEPFLPEAVASSEPSIMPVAKQFPDLPAFYNQIADDIIINNALRLDWQPARIAPGYIMLVRKNTNTGIVTSHGAIRITDDLYNLTTPRVIISGELDVLLQSGERKKSLIYYEFIDGTVNFQEGYNSIRAQFERAEDDQWKKLKYTDDNEESQEESEEKMEQGGSVEKEKYNSSVNKYFPTGYAVIDKLQEEAYPYIQELTDNYAPKFEEHFKRPFTDSDREEYQLMLIADLIKALAKHIDKDDDISDISLSRSKGFIVISAYIIRDGKQYGFTTRMIVAHGDIQRRHYRYLIKTTLPKVKTSTAMDGVKQQLSRIKKSDSVKQNIVQLKKMIEKTEGDLAVEKAKTKEECATEGFYYNREYNEGAYITREEFDKKKRDEPHLMWSKHLDAIRNHENRIKYLNKEVEKYTEKLNKILS